MASLPYPLCHECPADLVGMAGMPYPPTMCKDIYELLLKHLKSPWLDRPVMFLVRLLSWAIYTILEAPFE